MPNASTCPSPSAQPVTATSVTGSASGVGRRAPQRQSTSHVRAERRSGVQLDTFWRALLDSPTVDGRILEQAWRSNSGQGATALVAALVAAHPSLPAALRIAVGADRRLDVRKVWAGRSDLRPEEIEALGTDETRVKVLAILAANGALAQAVPEVVVTSASGGVLAALVANTAVDDAVRAGTLVRLVREEVSLTVDQRERCRDAITHCAALADAAVVLGGGWQEAALSGELSADGCRVAVAHLTASNPTIITHFVTQRALASVLAQRACPGDLAAVVAASYDAADACLVAGGTREAHLDYSLREVVRRAIPQWRPTPTEARKAAMDAVSDDESARAAIAEFGASIIREITVTPAVSEALVLELIDSSVLAGDALAQVVHRRHSQRVERGDEVEWRLLERLVQLEAPYASRMAHWAWPASVPREETVARVLEWCETHHGVATSSSTRARIVAEGLWPLSWVGQLTWNSQNLANYADAVHDRLAGLLDDEDSQTLFEHLAEGFTGTVDDLVDVCRAVGA